MRRWLWAVALLLPLAAPAHAQRLWQDSENTNGFCGAATMSGSCAMMSQADGSIVCVPSPTAHTFLGFDGTTIAWNTMAATGPWITAWPTGVLEGASGALTSFSSTVRRVPFGSGTAGGLTDSANFYYQNGLVSVNTTNDAGWFESDTASLSHQITLNNSTSGGGTGIRFLVNLTDVGEMSASALGTSWAVPAFAIQNTGGVTKFLVTSGGNIQIASLAGAGTQCVQTDNFGTLSGTGSPCGAGGAGGGSGTVTGVFGTDPIAVAPSTPNPTVSLNLAADMTVVAHNLTQADYPLVSRSTNAPANAVNLGSGSSGVEQQTVSGGVATVSQFTTSTGLVQYGAASGGGLAQSSNLRFDAGPPGVFWVGDGTNGTFAAFISTSTNAGAWAFYKDGSRTVEPSVAWSWGNGMPGAAPGSSFRVGRYDNVGHAWVDKGGWLDGAIQLNAATAPSTPGAGTADIYVDITSKNICAKNDAGTINHGVQSTTCGTSTWVNKYNDNGTPQCVQPAFSDLNGVLACGQIPSAGTCTPTTTDGASGSYITSITRDAKGWVTAVGTTTTPLEVTLSWNIVDFGLNLTYNQSDLVIPVSGGAGMELVASPGIAVASTLAANYGSSSNSPPTYPLSAAYGQTRCNVNVGSVSSTGSGSATLVFALYSVDTNPVTPSNWHNRGVTSTSTASVPSFETMGFVGGPPSIPSTSAVTPVFYRTDSNNLLTIQGLQATIVCTLGQ